MNYYYINENFASEILQGFVLQFEFFLQYSKKNWKNLVKFTYLQWSLFKLLCILLFLTSLLIAYSWKVYGKVITDKFVRPSTLKEIEELKLSVAKLKLPKEHSPRI